MPNCPQCDAELGPGDPAGLCPQCLILGAFDSSLGADISQTQTIHTVTAAATDEDFVRYHVVRPLGEGGMGTVYLAEQREPIRRTVALKVVKLGMDTNEVLTRFNHERQALAMMDHPNIARIFDAGATPKGRPCLLYTSSGCCSFRRSWFLPPRSSVDLVSLGIYVRAPIANTAAPKSPPCPPVSPLNKLWVMVGILKRM